jgi:phenylacetate-CoA ligase
MSFLYKKYMSLLPVFIGKYMPKLNIIFRLNSTYFITKKNISEKFDEDKIFTEFKKLVSYSIHNIPFYSKFYSDNNFSIDQLVNFDDISKVPIITKKDLKTYSLESRISKLNQKGVISNTGGTTGEPLVLYNDIDANARNIAHIHQIWSKFQYKSTSLILLVAGKNIGDSTIIYEPMTNEFVLNLYKDWPTKIKALNILLKKHNIDFIRGYPSAIYELAIALEKYSLPCLTNIKKNLKGIFLGSEYPEIKMRNKIESTFNTETISWYGHSELAILAYEKDIKYRYFVFQGSYGFAEAISENSKFKLIGTTLHNYVSPLIRYDTGDLINPITFNSKILESFEISYGRIGEFVIDENGTAITLTALIHGRHHKLFEFADYIQVYQIEKGSIIIIVTSSDKNLDCINLFDSTNIKMNIKFKIIESPIKSKSGKVPLLVQDYPF